MNLKISFFNQLFSLVCVCFAADAIEFHQRPPIPTLVLPSIDGEADQHPEGSK